MKPKHIKKVLMSEINKVANNPKELSVWEAAVLQMN